ncbi:MAG: outer membrane protein, partial [Bryobacterales bacterium]|nr:outer membrane protein [Bryobacterales bacterium]
MRKCCWISLAFAAAAQGESFTLTLSQAVARALTQSPEVVMARTDEMKAAQGVRLAKEPFSPRVAGGSGLAYSYGFPLSVEGSAPSVFQLRANQFLFNRAQSYTVAQAKETMRGAGFASAERREEVVFRVATLFIDVERAGRLVESVQKQVESLRKVQEAVNSRVDAGRELPMTKAEANVNLLRARQRLMALQAERDYAEHNLAVALGYNPGDVVHPSGGERAPSVIPDSEDSALKASLDSSKELRRLESNYQAKALEIKSDKAQRLPRMDLVAQYALFAKYSNYDVYFSRFQYNNAQIGASIQIPIVVGPGVNAQVMQAEADRQHIRAELQAARGRITLEVHQSYQDIEKAEMARQVTKAELDLAHEQLSVLLAQMNEGRAGLR